MSRLGTDDAQLPWIHLLVEGQQGFTWRRFEETPVPPRLCVASSSGGSVVLFRSRYFRVVSSRKGIDRCASRHVPAAELPSRLHAASVEARCDRRRVDERPRHRRRYAPSAIRCTWGNAAPARPRTQGQGQETAGCCQIGGCDRGGLGVTRAFCRRGGSGGRCVTQHGCTPRRAKQRTGSFSDASIVEETCVSWRCHLAHRR